jgi:hypothetical protein
MLMNWKETIHRFYNLCKTDPKCIIDVKDFYYLKDMYLVNEEELTIKEADNLDDELMYIEKHIFASNNQKENENEDIFKFTNVR